MNLEIKPVENDAESAPVSLPVPLMWWGRVLYGLFVTITTALAFWGTDFFKPEWQDGQFKSYLTLFLFPEASLLFILLLAYSIICYLLLLVAPARFSESFIVRLGIYTGAFLALQYSIITLIWSVASSVSVIIVLLLWASPFILLFLYRLAITKWTSRDVNKFLLILVLIGFLLALVLTRGSALLLMLAAFALASPFWSLMISSRAAIWLFKNHETKFTLPHGLGLVAWLSAYVAAWRFDILKMYELYTALPPQPPPDCYIATAAAHGHPRFVRSWTVKRADGKLLKVNAQLQILKCAELALAATYPNIHKHLRKLYDVIGKSLARRIQNPFLADGAYLLLKPFEWASRKVLRLIVHEIDVVARSMYIM
ncbi:MAG: hypothetical protein IPP66_09895 [Anaerolineales bacterium]|nr:hypothetical protein [Anaerolineales bacterium]